MTGSDTRSAAAATTSNDIPRVAVVGVHGYGAAHILNALDMQARGLIRLEALVDPEPGPLVRDGVRLPEDALPQRFNSIDDLLETTRIDIAVIATPLHTHAALTVDALRAGADVLLEKPPATELATLAVIEAAARDTGGLVQVGFQSLGSLALAELQRQLREGALGRPLAIGAMGSWTRSQGYWTRSRWAGRREMDGLRVADGAVANPFAHAVSTSLRIAGWESAAAIGEIETDLRRVNPIEADDTSAIRARPSESGARTFDGTLTCAFTLAGPRESEPVIVVRGTRADAVLSYTSDRLSISGSERQFGRIDLLENLVAARCGKARLLSPLSGAGGFVRVIEAVTNAPVQPVDAGHVSWEGRGAARRPVIDQAEWATRSAMESEALFSELPGLSWR